MAIRGGLPIEYAAILSIALALDFVFGWPDALHRRIGHPVVWIGAAIAAGDRRLNRTDATERQRRLRGLALVALVTGGAAMIGWLISWAMPDGPMSLILAGILSWPLLAARSLHDHVADVARPSRLGNLMDARTAVSRIVGRDPAHLDMAAIARASLESLAENTSDGVMAPVFWTLIFGLPGLWAYKAINTLDSMIGHKTPEHRAFGWAAARLDDAVNYFPARLTALLFALVSQHPHLAVKTALRDARHHRSINAGWPEAALAVGLQIRLCGPRVYSGEMAHEPWINGGHRDPEPEDISRGLEIYRHLMLLSFGLLVVLALV